MMRRFHFTPEHIEDLHPNEVFVFGSNANGNHYGGAANLAYQRFGAVWGVGEGLRGNSYALPTLNRNMERVSIGALKQAFKHLFQEIDFNPELCFLLTKVGCGIAGYTVEEVARTFWESVNSFYDGRWTTYVGEFARGIGYSRRVLQLYASTVSKNRKVQQPEQRFVIYRKAAPTHSRKGSASGRRGRVRIASGYVTGAGKPTQFVTRRFA